MQSAVPWSPRVTVKARRAHFLEKITFLKTTISVVFKEEEGGGKQKDFSMSETEFVRE